MTTRDSTGNTYHYRHRAEELAALEQRVKKVQQTLRNCRRGSRSWRKRQRLVRSLRGRTAAVRSHTRTQLGGGTRQGLPDGVLRAHGRQAAQALGPGHPPEARRAGQRATGPLETTRRRRPGRATSRASRGLRAPRRKVHRDPGEELVGILSGVRALHQREPQDPSAIPVHQVRAHQQRRRQRHGEPPRVGHVDEAQGRGQAALGGNSKAPCWRGQPGQGTGGKPGQCPGAATEPRTWAWRSSPVSRSTTGTVCPA